MTSTLTQFLATCFDQKDFFEKKSVVFFQGNKEYPLLFFAIFFKKLKTASGYSVETLHIVDQDFATTVAKLETTFLGNRTFYWLRDLSTLDEKKRSLFMKYLESYAGPNCVFFFLPMREKLNVNGCSIELPDAISKKDFMRCFSLFEDETTVKRSVHFIEGLFARNEMIPLEQACVFMRYAQVVGAGQKVFIDSWLDELLVPEKSLFSLSQFFFAKSPKKFFNYWSHIAQDYSEPFWVTFWSEQLWRSHYYVELMQQKKFAQAKSIAFRLPFSLIQTDWKKLRVEELRNAHNFLYSLDFSLKNGGTSSSLDLLYSKFFLDQF